MSERITQAIETVAVTLVDFDYGDALSRRVATLTRHAVSFSGSPCDDALVCARTCVSASVGMATAIEQGLHPTEIHDRDTLHHVIAALRASADLFEAIVREGTQ